MENPVFSVSKYEKFPQVIFRVPRSDPLPTSDSQSVSQNSSYRSSIRSVHSVQKFHWEAFHDLGKHWRFGVTWSLILLWQLALLASLIYVCRVSSKDFDATACRPDGTFSVDSAKYNYWAMSGFFQVTIGFGKMSFTQAKAVDFAWDLVFGRGGQAAIAVLSWRVFAKYTTTSMAVKPVTFSTYKTIFLQNDMLILAIPRVISDFIFRCRLRSKLAMVFMILTMTFTLVFPSFGSAMTGYSSNVKSFIPDENNNLVAFEKFQIVLFVIHDGDRIHHTKDRLVRLETIQQQAEPVFPKNPRILYHGESLSVLDYVIKYRSLSGLLNYSSQFEDVFLAPPTLNISAFWIPFYGDFDGLMVDGVGFSDLFGETYANTSRIKWIAPDQNLYDFQTITATGQCQNLDTYQWGFSYIQLNIMIIALLLWTAGLCMMHLQSYLIMKTQHRSHVAGENKAVLELARTMAIRLEWIVTIGDADDYSEKKLSKSIKENLQGGSIDYILQSLPGSGEKSEEKSPHVTRKFIRKERGWIFTLSVVLLMTIVSICMLYWVIALHLAIFALVPVFSRLVGGTSESRMVLLAWFSILLGILPLVCHYDISP
ncbi:hypothetical protein IQ07DRAFT_592741 [Pyrenochaeta sp. DS3sAY3a]|nr:hypothetical protein IQ07DRAFT_592741 [Pyrenochaeta sp. DS3sAY3a]